MQPLPIPHALSGGAPYMARIKHSMKRRCFCHDYYDRGIYMITVETEGRRPLLGRLVGERIEKTAIGEAVEDCWREIPLHHPEIQLLECMVMPDHFHGLLFVRKRMDKHLGEVVRGFKIGCTKALNRAMYGAPQDRTPAPESDRGELGAPPDRAPAPEPDGGGLGAPPTLAPPREAGPVAGHTCPARPVAGHTCPALWAPGYHDRILTSRGQLDILFQYVRENPCRLAARRRNPDYFTRINSLPLGGRVYAAYGNPFLLNRPDRIQIQCSRRISEEALAAERDRLLDAAERGAVLVSPCISPGEKAIARAALEEGLPLIALLENGFPPLYKPPGRYFEACEKGLLLLLAPWPHHPERRSGSGAYMDPRSGGGAYMPRITRAQCLALNAMAAEICGPGAAACDYAGLVP